MQIALALVPIALLLALLIGARWSAASAGAVAAGAAIVVTAFWFESPTIYTIAGPFLEALFQSATILWIIFPALCIHEFQVRNGGTALFGRALAGLSNDPRMVALLIAWFFVCFLEGAAGFGTPIALAAPLLVTAGFSPQVALLLAIVGNAAAVPFGAIGTPMAPLLAETGLDPNALSLSVALLNASVGWIMVLMVVRIATPGSVIPFWSSLGWALGAAALFFVPSALLAWTTGPELPSLGAALIGGGAFAVFLSRLRGGGRGRGTIEDRAQLPSSSGLLRAALPYLVVVGLILITRLVPPLSQALRAVEIHWSMEGGYAGSVAPLYHPGTVLMLAFLFSGMLQRETRVLISGAARDAARRLPRVALALLAVLTLARTMVHAGMIELLAAATAQAFGNALPLVAPLLGTLGAFVTGSGTASNILLGGFQASAAERAGILPMLAAAAQAVGAAAGNLVAPHNIVAGAATVGLVGKEGEILHRTLPLALLYAGAAGVVSLFASLVLFGTGALS
ncbi:L-lactate permease [Novosphingobium sp. M1R2S20]|uniref:L-lactate permease n=1 Tax=Novosphingobium rhizovicinum TaxID=3228928 RepID=A0ABV3RED2_9SPHN